MKTKKHPAVVLFEKLFAAEVAKDPNERGPYPPEHYVNRWQFHAECKKAGIEIPDNPVRQFDWEEEVGLRKIARKLIDAERRRVGKSIPARELGARKLERQLRRCLT